MAEGFVLDHVVFATRDVERSSSWIADVTGVTPSPGGAHVGRGTRNDLVSFGNGAYLEIIGPDPHQPEPATPRPFGLDRLAAQGVVTWCAQGTDLSGFVERAAAVGCPYDGPMAMERDAPAGLLAWDLALPSFDTHGGLVPFVIDWGDSPHPSATVAARLELVSCHAVHPEPAEVHRVLTDVGIALEISPGLSARLDVTVRGPDGEVTLPAASFA